jgi:hypothetical protein
MLMGNSLPQDVKRTNPSPGPGPAPHIGVAAPAHPGVQALGQGAAKAPPAVKGTAPPPHPAALGTGVSGFYLFSPSLVHE